MTHRPSQPVAGVWCLPLRKRGQTDTHARRATSAQTLTQTPPDRHPRKAKREVGPAARPWAACLHAEMMRVYLRTVPWAWAATAAAGLLTWNMTTDRAEDWASLACSPQGPDLRVYKCVPQSSPSEGVVK